VLQLLAFIAFSDGKPVSTFPENALVCSTVILAPGRSAAAPNVATAHIAKTKGPRGYGYGYGNRGIGAIGIIVIILVVLLLMGRL
jgi:hypothetical protein